MVILVVISPSVLGFASKYSDIIPRSIVYYLLDLLNYLISRNPVDQPGVSTDPCSVIYGGPHEQSEPELQAVVRFLQDRADVIKAYLAFHSYSQLWMMPYSYSDVKTGDYEELVRNSLDCCILIIKSYRIILEIDGLFSIFSTVRKEEKRKREYPDD